MNFLTNKTIFILSPVKWGKMKVSKHHYAIELASEGNTVYFIEPPDITFIKGFSKCALDEYKNLFIVSYKPIARGKKYLPKFLHRQLLLIQTVLLIRKINRKPDIVICFEPYRFGNLKWFKALNTVFFAADLFLPSLVPEEVKSADICLGVSPSIVSQLQINNPRSYYINHGLNAAFAEMANRKLLQLPLVQTLPFSKVLTVGYFGNLLIGSLDRITMKEVIDAHPEIKYIFWGQYEKSQDNMVAFDSKEVWEFIDFLKSSKNVTLMGPKDQDDLVDQIQEIDLFWICYDNNATWQVDGSNSHKILEYLATGKPVISSYIFTYKDSDLIYMNEEDNNKKFAFLFDKILETVLFNEDEKLIKKRLKFALQNTYKKQIEFIDSLFST